MNKIINFIKLIFKSIISLLKMDFKDFANKILKPAIKIGFAIFIAIFVLENLFPAELSFIIPHKQGDFVRVGNLHKNFLHSRENQAVLLNDGRVFITDTITSQIYNPKNRRFKLIKDKTLQNRYDFRLSKLKDGKVILIGGSFYQTTPEETFIFNPNINKFEKGSKMLFGRSGHEVMALNDGRVFVVGGYNQQKGKQPEYIYSTEFFNSKINEFEKGPEMPIKISNFKLLLDKDGNVVIIGGSRNYKNKEGYIESIPNTDVFVFNPRFNTITKNGNLVVKRYKQDIFMLNSGEILIMQGFNVKNGKVAEEIEIYNPKTGISSIISILPKDRRKSSIRLCLNTVKLVDDTVILYGGVFQGSFAYMPYFEVDKFNTKTKQYEILKKMNNVMTSSSKSIYLYNDDILLINGGVLENIAHIYKTK
ncbi:MAG: kelch repeat-containing protein [Candidatus Gastranaerophilales bacterium]|nr:kelch repeat-containing protein [Candidatus Gastranaerophilales bacterium]